jgi:quinohemoprotein ethanol dehydrogenase
VNLCGCAFLSDLRCAIYRSVAGTGRKAPAAERSDLPRQRYGVFMRTSWVGLLTVVCVRLASLAHAGEVVVDGRAIADERQGANWLAHGRTYSENYYSPLASINDHTVKQLGLAWFLDLPGQRVLEATPLAVDGVLYFSGTHGKTFAVDARSGKQLWEFDAESGNYRPSVFRFSGGAGGHRGVAYWRGKVYVGVIDGRLFALNARTGRVEWAVQTFADLNSRMTISGAPRVFNGKVVIGQNGDPGARGYVTAYDAETGQERWRFYTVPGDPAKGFENEAMAMAAKTWSGQWWKSGGNGSVWDSIAYDPAFNRIYLATANWIPQSSADQGAPKSDNLFVSSIIAVDADTGKYVWHYQENPRGDWDYDSNMPMVLADLRVGGTPRKVLLHAPKNGFFYVIDRADGKLISAEKFAKVSWAERIDLRSGRPIEVPDVRDVWPSVLGAHNWQPMSFNPDTGLVYIPTMNLGMHWPISEDAIIRAQPNEGVASLLAWDPVAQKKRWEVRYSDSFWNSGTMTTAGNLVFHGTARGQFSAYDASTGAKLWSFDAGLGIVSTPISYAVDDTQYISVLVGYGGAGSMLFDYGWRFNEQPRRLLTFALSKGTSLPPGGPPRYRVNAIDDPALIIDSERAAKGFGLYNSSGCSGCHGGRESAETLSSFAPDLRESALAMNWQAFKAVVHGGSRAAAGMPQFEELTDEEMRAIYMCIRQWARDAAHSSH